jgi:histidyl-tRNA synthetase
LARQLRDNGHSALQDYEGRSMKAQLKAADRFGAKWAVIIGDDELAGQMVTLRDLKGSDQRQVPRDELLQSIRGSH